MVPRIFAFLVFLALASLAAASTTITYQGYLEENDEVFAGSVNLEFTLFTSSEGTQSVGDPVSIGNVSVTDGLFQVPLDFGDVAYEEGLWLQIAVNGVPLNQRQPITAAPLSIRTLHPPQGGGEEDESFWTLSGSNIYYSDGNVGIGTSSPNAPLHVRGDGSTVVFRAQNQSGGTRFRVDESGGVSVGANSVPPNGGLYVRTDVESRHIAARGELRTNASASSNLSYIRFRDSAGTSGPRLFHNQDQDQVYFSGIGRLRLHDANFRADGDVSIGGNVTGSLRVNNRLHVNANQSSDFSYVCFRDESCNGPRIYHTTATDRIVFRGVSGIRVRGLTRTEVLQIDGADIAEEFPFSEPVEPGMLVSIDPEHPGQLKVARDEYDPLVAGIIPGANDFSTGIVLGTGTGNENAAPVALSGRVYVKAIGTTEIRPGDLLTSSSIPGYAMAATDRIRLLGASIGKAMTPLAEGEEGMVLVLVNLQ